MLFKEYFVIYIFTQIVKIGIISFSNIVLLCILNEDSELITFFFSIEILVYISWELFIKYTLV